MSDDSILSLSTAGLGERAAVTAPSAVLDLIYACYYLRGLRDARREPLPWAEPLQRDEPELVAAAADLVEHGDEPNSLFAMALELGYFGDEEPKRFLEDLPELPRLLEVAFPAEGGRGAVGDVPSWLHDPPDAAWARHAKETLSSLWRALRPVWEATGRPAALAAAREIEQSLAEHGDVLRVLPRRHFSQFESLAASLREAHARGRLLIVPLAFAAGGGFHLKGDRLTAVGFGLHGERVHEAIEGRVAKAAAGAKALADPTRLMLLSLITRFDSVSVTVTDLAQQLGVSQPTVSGHLKQLREAGLVTTERQGNKTFPKASPEAIRKTLEELADLLRD